MTKYEALYKSEQISKSYYFEDNKDEVLKAMGEYSDYKCIDFGKWLQDNIGNIQAVNIDEVYQQFKNKNNE